MSQNIKNEKKTITTDEILISKIKGNIKIFYAD